MIVQAKVTAFVEEIEIVLAEQGNVLRGLSRTVGVMSWTAFLRE